MSDTQGMYDRIQSVRIKNLEQQFNLMHRELQRMREGMLHQNDGEKLNNLIERLKELNLILIDLRNYYSDMKQDQTNAILNENNTQAYNSYTKYQKKLSKINNKVKFENNITQGNHSPRNDCINNEHIRDHMCKDNQFCNLYSRPNPGLNKIETMPEAAKESQLIKLNTEAAGTRAEENSDPFETCKYLMNESKSPGSILGNYLLNLQDFRADPEIRRRRLERKQREKLQQIKGRNYIMTSKDDKADLMEKPIINNSATLSPETIKLENQDGKLTNSQYAKGDPALPVNFPVVRQNLSRLIDEIVNGNGRKDIALTIVMENDLYHISISNITNGQTLACFHATDEAIQDAKEQRVFQDFLTFLVVNAENSKSQKDRILGHLFEFFQTNIS